MKKEYRNNVIPVFSNFQCGSGVIVGNLFITAGHLLANGDVYTKLDGKTIPLSKQNAFYYEYEGDDYNEYVMDVAVFELEECVENSLVLSEETPVSGDELVSISHLHSASYSNPEATGLLKDIRETIEVLECSAIVHEKEGNYFTCQMGKVLAPGSSGSPVFKGNEVVGILNGGTPGKPICVFLSSSRILEKIKSIESQKS